MTVVAMADITGESLAKIEGKVSAALKSQVLGKLAIYVTGSGGIPETSAELAALPPGVAIIRIDQSPDLSVFAAGNAEVADVESLAGTDVTFAAAVKRRIAEGIEWSTAYRSASAVPLLRAALEAAGPRGWFYGHVDLWVANWSLSQGEAAALVGQEVEGITVRAVQWASPSSNPGTVLPGTGLSLSQANADLSEAAGSWHPGAVVPPVLPPPAAKGIVKVTVNFSDGSVVTLP